MNGIFISYRREDAGGFARGIYDHLRQHFDPRYIFRDIDSIKGGEDFVETIETAVASCAAVLVVIGKRWSDIKDETGQRRLDQPHDFVRLEIAAALRRNIPVIPILLQDTRMPSPSALPEDIEPLTRRHALKVSDDRWEFDLARVVERLDEIPGLQEIRKPATPDEASDDGTGRRKLLTGIAVFAVVAAAMLGWLILRSPAPPRLGVDPAALGFGEQTIGTRSDTKPVTVRNNGEAPVRISDVMLQGEARRSFVLQENRCRGATLASKEECRIALAFSPPAKGEHIAILKIDSQLSRADAEGSELVTLRGVGREPRVRLTIDGVDVIRRFASSAVQVRAIVNREEYRYPSVGSVEWLEVGPEMTTQSFSLPFARDPYRLRFEMRLRHQGELFNLVSQDEDEVAFGSLPVSMRYALFNKDSQGTRGATPLAWVKYTITSTP